MLCSQIEQVQCVKNSLHYLQNFCLIFWMSFLTIRSLLASQWSLVLLMGFFPVVAATKNHDTFSGITFRAFSEFVEQNFSSRISLASVLVVLFTMTSNPDLLNLHARQQNPSANETCQVISGWIKALAQALDEKLGVDTPRLFHKSEQKSTLSDNERHKMIAIKLDALSKLLELYPYNADGQRQRKLKSVPEIEPAHVICPVSMECQTTSCQGQSLHMNTRDRDVPRVTLIKGTRIYEKVHVLSGKCTLCQTTYYADHESSKSDVQNKSLRLYLNNAKYLKIGRSVWVDRIFSGGVVNGIYSFHASSSAYAEFWNDTFWSKEETESRKISRRQVWHAFVQESLRVVAQSSGHTLEIENGLSLEKVTKQAYTELGENGVIRSADQHFCSECTHNFKRTADRITGDDPAAVLGIDENHNVPALTGEDADLAVRDAAQARFRAQNAMDIDEGPSSVEESPVKLVVLDGVVMGPTHCAYDNCTKSLKNARRGVFCEQHEILRGNLCRMHGCNNSKALPSHTCAQHQNRWHQHVIRYGRQSLLGIRRLIRRSEEERLTWLPSITRQIQQHDEEPASSENQKDNYFVAPRFYCVETICAPCGAVIAWTKFAKAESPTNILNFLESVYPTPELRPNYICIDKACKVLRTAISNGSWQIWRETSRFIVDSYHYINHRTTDYLCRKWCNPAPLNGSAPNLVDVVTDVNGNLHYRRAFNTQVCIFFDIVKYININLLFTRHVNS